MAKQKSKNYILTRDKYKAIKRYDHQQMEMFCCSVYESGMKDGYDLGQAGAIEAVLQAAAKVKGIGPKKLEEIRSHLAGGADGE